MPDLVRWPQFRKSLVSESEQKVFDLIYIVDSQAVVSRGLQELSIDAFSNSLTQAEARTLIIMFMHKDQMMNENRQTASDKKSNTLRINNDLDIEDE